MELVAADGQLLEKIEGLYSRSFPEEEKKPYDIMVKNSRQGKGEMLAIMEDGRFLGHALTAFCEDLVLLDYFAVEDDLRGQGVGGRALSLLKERYADRRFFLEVESTQVACDNMEQRIRRKRFYHDNGMKDGGLTVNVRGVVMEVLVADRGLTFDEYRGLYRHAFGEAIYRQVRKEET